MRVECEEDERQKETDSPQLLFFAHHQRLDFFNHEKKKKKKKTLPERLDELRALNRKTFEETGEYMTEEEIRAFRQPRWTDRREFQDDD